MELFTKNRTDEEARKIGKYWKMGTPNVDMREAGHSSASRSEVENCSAMELGRLWL